MHKLLMHPDDIEPQAGGPGLTEAEIRERYPEAAAAADAFLTAAGAPERCHAPDGINAYEVLFCAVCFSRGVCQYKPTGVG